jgi:hypothetical protein
MNPDNLHYGFHKDIDIANRGWVTHIVVASPNSNIANNPERWREGVGFVKVCYIPKEAYKIFVPSVWHYKVLMSGWSLPQDNQKDPIDITTEDKLELMSRYNFGRNEFLNMPLEDRKPYLAEFEKMIEKEFELDMKEFKAFQVDRPFVQYADVQGVHRRKGIATRLYFELADRLDEMGLSLHSSGCQSDSAEAFWKHLRKNYPERVRISKSKYHDPCYRIKVVDKTLIPC